MPSGGVERLPQEPEPSPSSWGGITLTQRGGDRANIANQPEQQATTTIAAPASTGEAVNSSVVDTEPPASASSTTVAPTTTAAPEPTVVPGATQSELDQWALDYVGGTPGPVSGDPVKIGVAFYAANAARAAASYMNESIGGIGGRPVEIVTCDTWNDPVAEAECGATFAADAEMDFVIEPRSSQALLDALRPDQIPFGMWYWQVPPDRSGPSYAPSWASMMVAATKFFRGKLADIPNPRILLITPFPMSPDDITKLYPEAQVAVVSPQPSLNAELERLGITEADAVFVDSWDDCGALDPALEQFGPNLVRYTWTCMDRPEGWFLGHVIDDPKNPAVTLGSATATRQLELDGPQPDGLYGYLPFARTDPELLFGDILTIAKLYNMAGGTQATPEDIRQNMLGFTADAIFFGEQDCSLMTTSPAQELGYNHQQSCAKFVNIHQVQNGAYILAERFDVSTW